LHIFPPPCYSLYGVDLLFLRSGKVVMLEVNSWPGMDTFSEKETADRNEMLRDTFQLAGMPA